MTLESAIVHRVAHVYERGDHVYYFRFHDGFLSVREMLEKLVPALPATTWPFDKRELSRIWHQLVAVPIGRRPEEFRHRLNPPRCNEECVQVPTAQTLCRQGPVNVPFNRDGAPVEQVSTTKVTHEVLLSTLWTEWYMASDSYAKKYNIPRAAKTTTLFICQTDVGTSNVRYSLTWMPHSHRSGITLEEPHRATESECKKHSFAPNAVFGPASEMLMSCIVWNSRAVPLDDIKAGIANIVRGQNPMMMVITETRLSRAEAVAAAEPFGFRGMIAAEGNASRGGMWLLWNPRWIRIEQHPFYDRCIHATIEGAGDYDSRSGTTYVLCG